MAEFKSILEKLYNQNKNGVKDLPSTVNFFNDDYATGFILKQIETNFKIDKAPPIDIDWWNKKVDKA